MNSVPVKAINLSKEMGIDVLYDNYEYTVVAGFLGVGSSPNINTNINTSIKNGWKLYGGLILSPGQIVYQAMIRKLPAKGGNRTRRNR